MIEKTLAKHSEIYDSRWVQFMDTLNSTASCAGLSEYRTYSRIWEYPWFWFRIQELGRNNLHVLDTGSERSPFPWYLATQGYNVTVSDVTEAYWGDWKKASRMLGVKPRLRILDSQDLDLRTESVDVYESISILEHIPDKAKALSEAARVLRRGGLLLLTFDICESDLGMTFPDWNGRAVSMREFDELFSNSPWFEPGLANLKWNVENIPDYLAWHRGTAAHHNYVTGAIAIRRNQAAWAGTGRKGRTVEVAAACRTLAPALRWQIQDFGARMKGHLPSPIRSALRAGKSWFKPAR
jgi:SAM-dependent methyltransferase